MPTVQTGLIRKLFSVLLLATLGHAAKTVIVLNPWASDAILSSGTPQIFGTPNNWNGDMVAANQFQRVNGNLWSFTFTSNTPGDFRLLNRATSSTGSNWNEYGLGGLANGTSFNLDAQFATQDTLWIVPDTTTAARTPVIRTTSPVVVVPPAKRGTLMLLNPWATTDSGRAPSMQVSGSAWTALAPVAGNAGWYSGPLSFSTTLQVGLRNASGTSYLGAGGLVATPAILTLDTAFARNDTIWVVPTTAAPRILSAAPVATSTVIMLLNPWEALLPGRAPSIQVEAQAWKPFTAVTGGTGWYSTSTAHISRLQVSIRKADTTAWLGTTGSVTTPAVLLLDSARAKNDTIWLVSFSGTVRALSQAPRIVRLMVFNPWDGVFPLQRPVAYFDGSAVGNPMVPSRTQCGWYELALPVLPSNVLLRSSGTGVAFGLGGLTKTTPLSLAGITADSIWIAPAPAPTGSSLGVTHRSDSGTCNTAILATTVHDFGTHPNFNQAISNVVTGMIQDTLDSFRKPVLKANLANNNLIRTWFRDSAGANAATCRDIALTMDTLTGTYRIDQPEFFPVDDFLTLPNGTPNPFNNLNTTGNTYTHNFAFCMESHGEFEYKPGQVLDFRGDDDLFYFIDGKLRMELGGIHGPASGSILLDTMGLTVGQTYPWDFFFCERRPTGSSFRITTSMNLRTDLALRFQDSVSGRSSVVQIWSAQTIGRGCAATKIEQPAPGQVFLIGPDASTWTRLPVGTSFGGIRVSDSGWQTVLDTSALTGLPYGHYVVRVRSARDTGKFRDLPFSLLPPEPPKHKLEPGARCDLLSGKLPAGEGCLDVGSLDGTTLRTPLATTRLSSDGLVLCGTGSVVVPGTDIAYIVDQSSSMDGGTLLFDGKDTINFSSCQNWTVNRTVYPAGAPLVNINGSPYRMIPTSMTDSAMARCAPSGDPYTVRVKTLQAAIAQHGQASPTSQAAWISFGGTYHASSLANLGDLFQRDSLINGIQLEKLTGTNYANPLGWARALLQGATGPAGTMPGSVNQRKAIIMISDGSPQDGLAGIFAALGNSPTVIDPNGANWTLASGPTPPVFGIMLSNTAQAGNVLDSLARRTGGRYFLIPPLDRDSFTRAMSFILGSVINKGTPDSLQVTNTTNGQVSVGVASTREGSGWRFRLDSLVGLEPGPNVLQLRNVLHLSGRDSVVSATWTVVVSDSAPQIVPNGPDSTVMAACFDPTRLRIRPARDTSRLFADVGDTELKFLVDYRYDRQMTAPLWFATDMSKDAGFFAPALAAPPTGVRALVEGVRTWSGTKVDPTDNIVQTSTGWDTVRAIYVTPRDKRDVATAFLPVRRPSMAGIFLSPDTAEGKSGMLLATVIDSNVLADTVLAKVYHSRGDTVRLVLRRDVSGNFTASFAFHQASPIVVEDPALQMGPQRQFLLDTVFGSYGKALDTAYLRRPPPRLRFINAAGIPFDNLPFRTVDLGTSDTLRIGLFVGDSLLRQDIPLTITFPPTVGVQTLPPAPASALVLGSAFLQTTGLALSPDGLVTLRALGLSDSLQFQVGVVGYHLRYIDPAGNLVDSASIDRDVLTDTLLRIEVWNKNGLCATCNGWMSPVQLPGQILLLTPAGVPQDSIEIVAGKAAFRVFGASPIQGQTLRLWSASLAAGGTIAPVTFRPYRLRFLDAAGQALDAFSVDTVLRSRVVMDVQLWGMHGPVAFSASMKATALDPDISVSDISGVSGSTFVLANGRARLWLRSDAPVDASALQLSVDSLWAAVAAQPLTWRSLPPASAVYQDMDGDGGLDRVTVRLQLPWSPSNAFALPWPAAANLLDLSKAKMTVSADSLSVEWNFDSAQSPRTTGWIGSIPQGAFVWSAGRPAQAFPIFELIAPIPVRAQLRRGSGVDTLVVSVSEPLDASLVNAAADLVRRIAPASSVTAANATWDPVRNQLRLEIGRDSVDRIVRPGDSVRLAANGQARDAGGAAPGIVAPSVVVEGLDQLPTLAVVTDDDADGKADHVTLHFAIAPRVVDAYTFRWPDRDGILQSRTVGATPTSTDSGGLVQVFAIEPWAFGATSCSNPGCSGLGTMWTTRWADTLSGRFDELDRVMPVIIKAQLRFARTEGPLDTLRAILSEPVTATDGGIWINWGKPSRNEAGDPVVRKAQVFGKGNIVELYVDSTFLATASDSVRIAQGGGIADLVGNAPGSKVLWTPLEIGPTRLKLQVQPWPAMANYTGWQIPPSEPPLSVYVRATAADPWRGLDGSAPAQDASHYAGLLLKTNKDLDDAAIYVYDNSGVAVTKIDLSPVQELVRKGLLPTTIRGDVQVWIAWNGKGSTMSMASSGVYLFRVIAWKMFEGKREMVHQVYTLGWRNPITPAPPKDLPFLPQYDW
ncbi:MAG: fibro-slime domain-containing protein [Fibrobacteres bacterium]|nr:fibro-slime domain-containing protein [Fibrobacterota bacterium]